MGRPVRDFERSGYVKKPTSEKQLAHMAKARAIYKEGAPARREAKGPYVRPCAYVKRAYHRKPKPPVEEANAETKALFEAEN